MNREKNDSIAHAVRKKIWKAGEDRLWTLTDFPGTNRTALAAALSRMVKSGDLMRIRRGIYYRPKKTVFGSSKPDPVAFADAVLRARGQRPLAIGVGAYNRLGLTTQMSGTISRATGRRVRHGAVPGIPMDASLRPLDAQKGIKSDERAALDALRDIERIPDADPPDVLRRLGTLIRKDQLDYVRLARYAQSEPPRVRALLGALGEELRHANIGRRVPLNAITDLRDTLNPLTRFKVRQIDEALPRSSKGWRISG
jgi:hypothetical protein